jgi:hypothetical protein
MSSSLLDAKKQAWKQEVLWFLASSAHPFANHPGDVYIFKKLESARIDPCNFQLERVGLVGARGFQSRDPSHPFFSFFRLSKFFYVKKVGPSPAECSSRFELRAGETRECDALQVSRRVQREHSAAHR